MDYAAMNEHLEVIKWLHANRREGCTARVAMYSVARFGHRDTKLDSFELLHVKRSYFVSTNGCAQGEHKMLWLTLLIRRTK
jgi:hypothetical protein